MPHRSPSLTLLLKLHDSINEIICVIDGEGRYVYINAACYKIWGYKQEEIIGKKCYDFLVKEDALPSEMAVQDAQNGVFLPTYENRYHRKDGSIATMFWEGGWDPVDQFMYCTGRDITEQRRMQQVEKEYQEMLKQGKERLENLLNRITDGFVGLDEDARVTYWNRAAETLTRIPRNAVLGKVLWEVIPGPMRASFMRRYQEVKKASVPASFEIYSEGIKRWIEINTYVSGNGLSIYFRDITEKRKLQEQLQQEQDLQQKRITAAVIKATEEERAHVGKELHDNVNQVLTTVKLYNELCLTDLDNREVLLKKSTQLLQDSINEIRGLSKRLSAPSLGGIRLNESIKELVEAISATKRLSVCYENEVEELDVPEEVHVAIYRILQEQFTNILKHAKASKASVKVTMEDHTLQLTIQDNGQGFDPIQYRKGIGIENMTSRAQGLNGSLELNSAPGNGCTLLLSVPLA